MSLTLGLPLLLGLGLVLLCLLRRERLHRDAALPVLRAMAGFGIFALVLTLQVFPWDFVQTWLGRTAGKLAGLFQYPWRFLSLATLLFCAAVPLALRLLRGWRPRAVRTAAIVLAGCIALTAGIFYTQLLTGDQSTYNTIARDDTRDVGVGEYTIDGTSIYETVWAQPKPGSEQLTLTGYEKRGGVAYLSVENAGDAADISVPIFNYGHYTAADAATGESFAVASGENARVVLTIPAGYSGTIAIAWQSPAWWRGCEALSALCALGCLGYALLRRRAAQRRTAEG